MSESLSTNVLPPYVKSLLRIRTPAVVRLATARMPMRQVLSWAPGAILQFDKRCDEMLELEVGGMMVASGEAVKVGEKFALRVCSIKLPDERFKAVKGAVRDGASKES